MTAIFIANKKGNWLCILYISIEFFLGRWYCTKRMRLFSSTVAKSVSDIISKCLGSV